MLSTLVVLLIAISSIVIFVIYLQSRRREAPVDERSIVADQSLYSFWSSDGNMAYENIIEATGDFDSENCIGMGGFGRVYKAKLSDEQTVAVKKLHTSDGSLRTDLRGFRNEIQALTKIKHRNIVKLYGFCSHVRHSFLVYEFFDGGSLASLLGNDEKAMKFEWPERVNVVKGIASALSYMHHDITPPIIHRDISSKNILLDSEHEAHISDFGTAKFLNPDSSNQASFAGTFGYAAPGKLQFQKVLIS